MTRCGDPGIALDARERCHITRRRSRPRLSVDTVVLEGAAASTGGAMAWSASWRDKGQTQSATVTYAGLAAMGLGAVIGAAELLRSRGALERPVVAPMGGAGTTGLMLSSRC